MKTSRTKLKSSLCFLVLVSFSALAKPVAQVTELNGSVFIITPDGKTSALKLNDRFEEKSEIMVEEGASVTLNDYYDATYHLVGGTHLKMYDRSVQLKKGKTWIQASSARHPLALTTANGNASFWKGEFITTFDQTSARSQFLVINGEVEVSNVLDKNMKYSVSAGTFTMIDPDVENGVPRSPTKVGLNSLNQALAEFKSLPMKLKENEPSRAIASVETSTATAPKRGEIIMITSSRMPASVTGEARKYFLKKHTRAETNLTHAPIHFYGTTKLEFSVREPASIAPSAAPKAMTSTSQMLKNDPEFSDSLKKQTFEQPKYPKELDTLIQDLKSF